MARTPPSEQLRESDQTWHQPGTDRGKPNRKVSDTTTRREHDLARASGASRDGADDAVPNGNDPSEPRSGYPVRGEPTMAEADRAVRSGTDAATEDRDGVVGGVARSGDETQPHGIAEAVDEGVDEALEQDDSSGGRDDAGRRRAGGARRQSN
ncbi:MAG: hypothetical protein R3B68_16220 [Phycisphaerales bacterium]